MPVSCRSVQRHRVAHAYQLRAIRRATADAGPHPAEGRRCRSRRSLERQPDRASARYRARDHRPHAPAPNSHRPVVCLDETSKQWWPRRGSRSRPGRVSPNGMIMNMSATAPPSGVVRSIRAVSRGGATLIDPTARPDFRPARLRAGSPSLAGCVPASAGTQPGR